MDTVPEAAVPSTLRVVVGLAFDDADGLAFDQAASVAERVAYCELHLVHVFDAEPSESRAQELVEHLRLYVNEKAAALPGRAMTVGIHLRVGKPVRELAKLADEASADLIVIGSHKGPHLRSRLLGSTAEHLVVLAKCPVLIAAPKRRAARDGGPAMPSR